MADEKRAILHDVLIARVMDVCRAKSEEEWAAAREIERLREQLANQQPTPPAGFHHELVPDGAKLSYAELQAAAAKSEASADQWATATTQAIEREVAAEAALAACRDKTIEECAVLADADDRHGYEPYEAVERIVKRLRALKTKEPTNG